MIFFVTRAYSSVIISLNRFTHAITHKTDYALIVSRTEKGDVTA
jgi:hypothetical protein